MKVQRKRDELTEAGATAVFVAFDDPDLLRSTMLDGVELAFPFLVDRDRSAYAAWGLGRLPWHKVWLDPDVWLVYLRLLRDGYAFRGLGSDTRQMGGDFVVDGTTVAYSRPQRKDDRPPAGELLQVVRSLGS